MNTVRGLSPFRAPAALLLLALPLLSAAPPGGDASLALLRQTAENYRNAKTFAIEGDIRADIKAGTQQQSTTASFTVALGEGGRLHDQLDHPQVGTTRVSDGRQTWTYMTSTNQYTLTRDADVAQAGQPTGGMLPVLLANLRGMADAVDSVRVLADGDIPYQGETRRCAVLEVHYRAASGAPAVPGAPRTFWIDKEKRLVLQHLTATRGSTPDGRVIEQTETFRFTRITLSPPIEPGLFTFTPPAGAKKVEQLGGRPPGEDLTGQIAADFTLPDLAGRKHTLKSLRGKVVMLDFWASWCGPCRRQMPMVEKLGQEMKGQGLVVYAVNQGESSETARRYLEKNNYSTTTLLDQKAEVGRQYKVSGIPTLVIIDRQGKIAAHYIGLRPESVLREALSKAGL